MGAANLPSLIVIKSSPSKGLAYYMADGSVLVGDQSVFSPQVKIEAETAKDPAYVHLRFCYSNKYWQRKANSWVIVAVSNQPEEDIRKPSCTLFEPKVDNDTGLLYFTHVQSGGRLSINESTKAFYVEQSSSYSQSGNLNYLNWNSLVQLPKNVAFKGYNNSWLGGILSLGVNYLQYSVDDPNTPITTYKIQTVPDGHVRIFSNYFNKYCRRSDYDWIAAETTDASAADANTLFWPVKIDDTTIALRNAGNNNFCIGLDAYDKTRCLNATAPNMTNATHIVVQELVSKRTIRNVRYLMEDARIYKETPFLAGTVSAYNYSDVESSIAVEVSYEDSKSVSFTSGNTVTAGVKAAFDAGVPLIVDAKIEMSAETSVSSEWNTTTTITKSVKATGTVPVPPRSRAVAHYVGTRGSCDVPFTYTQEDTSSIDGRIITSDVIYGIFTGVNAYNYSFIVDHTVPL